MKQIQVGRGKLAIVDDGDFDAVSAFNWHLSSRGSGMHSIATGRGILLHRLIMQPPDGMVVDHINGDPLDNRRCNLRVCTPIENARNRKQHKHSTTPFKGVQRMPENRHMAKPWRARIYFRGKQIHLGLFETAEEAARAYDAGARDLFGEFARTNFDGSN